MIRAAMSELDEWMLRTSFGAARFEMSKIEISVSVPSPAGTQPS